MLELKVSDYYSLHCSQGKLTSEENADHEERVSVCKRDLGLGKRKEASVT